jgi:hypothetical protein
LLRQPGSTSERTRRSRNDLIDFSSEAEALAMDPCHVCGNVYDKSFEVSMAGRRYVFDTFECAIQALAPTCAHCSCRVIGHGVEAAGVIYCCAHCAKQLGEERLQDRA